MDALTRRQREVLGFIADFTGEKGYAPAISEIAEYFGISGKAVHDHIGALKRKNRLQGIRRSSRTLQIVHKEGTTDYAEFADIPLIGEVAAESKLSARDEARGIIRMHHSMLATDKTYFALKVRGDSMSGIGVMDGDTVIIQEQGTAQNGDVVVVDSDDGGRMLKRYFRQYHRIKLVSENPKYPPVYSTGIHILGKLAGVYRSYAV